MTTPTILDRVLAFLKERNPELARQFQDGIAPESLQFHTNVHIVLRDARGRYKARRVLHNLICTVGKNLILASGGTAEYPKQFSYIAIGTGTTAAAIGDTALQAEVARALSTVSNPSSNTLQFVVTFAAGTGTGAITESGLLDAASVGNILAHQIFAVINKGASDSLAITWQIT